MLPWRVAFQVAYFNSLEIDAPDAATLFDLLDYDKSGEIDIEEGRLGTWILQGCETCAPKNHQKTDLGDEIWYPWRIQVYE